jgi:hypothetical protein
MILPRSIRPTAIASTDAPKNTIAALAVIRRLHIFKITFRLLSGDKK